METEGIYRYRQHLKERERREFGESSTLIKTPPAPSAKRSFNWRQSHSPQPGEERREDKTGCKRERERGRMCGANLVLEESKKSGSCLSCEIFSTICKLDEYVVIECGLQSISIFYEILMGRR